MKKIILIFTFLIVLSQISYGQTEKSKLKKSIHLGVINGMATNLPKPEYTGEAEYFCAKGIVKVNVLIDENGNVIKAKAISGDELLLSAAVKSAKKAKFGRNYDGEPVKIRGILIYNFDSLSKCISAGIVNKKALSIPKPQIANLNHLKTFSNQARSND